MSVSDCRFYLASVTPNWNTLSFSEQNKQINWHMQKEVRE